MCALKYNETQDVAFDLKQEIAQDIYFLESADIIDPVKIYALYEKIILYQKYFSPKSMFFNVDREFKSILANFDPASIQYSGATYQSAINLARKLLIDSGGMPEKQWFKNQNEKKESVVLPILISPRLVVRLPKLGEEKKIVEHLVKNRLYSEQFNLAWPDEVYTEGFWQNRIPDNIRSYQRGEDMKFFIFDKKEGLPIGRVYISSIQGDPWCSGELSYVIDENMQRKGLATEAVCLVIQRAFSSTHLRRIVANYNKNNVRSAKLLENLNFKTEGILRQYMVLYGVKTDFVSTSLLKEEWIVPNST